MKQNTNHEFEKKALAGLELFSHSQLNNTLGQAEHGQLFVLNCTATWR